MKHPTGHTLCRTFMTMALALLSIPPTAWAADLTVTMRKATQDGTGATIGTVVIDDGETGASLKLDLHGLPPGSHGFMVHENASCDPIMMNGVRIPGGAAGGAFDPNHTYKHAGPTGEGYLGDLPAVDVEDNGSARQTLTAPRIKDISALKGRSLVIHNGGDTYSDSPSPMGGMGARIACGVIGS